MYCPTCQAEMNVVGETCAVINGFNEVFEVCECDQCETTHYIHSVEH